MSLYRVSNILSWGWIRLHFLCFFHCYIVKSSCVCIMFCLLCWMYYLWVSLYMRISSISQLIIVSISTDIFLLAFLILIIAFIVTVIHKLDSLTINTQAYKLTNFSFDSYFSITITILFTFLFTFLFILLLLLDIFIIIVIVIVVEVGFWWWWFAYPCTLIAAHFYILYYTVMNIREKSGLFDIVWVILLLLLNNINQF